MILFKVDLFNCSGTIVDSDHVVTAAHCLWNSNKLIRDDYAVGRVIAVGNRYPLWNPKEECGKQVVALLFRFLFFLGGRRWEWGSLQDCVTI